MTTADVTMVRVYCSEHSHQYKQIIDLLHQDHKVAGVTAFRGIIGFGGSGRLSDSSLIDISLDLPVIIEFFDRTEKVEEVMKDLEALAKPGHIVTWAAKANL